MKIAVDAMGGDYAPSVVVEGAVWAAKEFDIHIILVGDKAMVEDELAKHNWQGLPISVIHASQVVGMDESPGQAIRRKKDSSIKVCFDLVKSGEASAAVSAGNSGAAMAAGIFVLRNLQGVERPAIAVIMPTKKEPVIVLDAGGNVDCKPIHLVQFAVMGSVYAKYILKKNNPKIGVLSNGEEEGKGNDLTRETNEILKDSSLNYLNYLGYVEGRDIFSGDVDVVVCDGFVGNVVLKVTEGVAEALTSMLKKEILSSPLAKMGYLLAKGALLKVKKKVDYSEYGGAPLLGIDGIGIISHGASDAKAIKNAIKVAVECTKNKLNRHLLEELEKNHDIQRLCAKQSLRCVEEG
ncbi:MAG: phosphate acyltransferase [Deltaproteobacteria bacterium RIFCSPLOWO2_12_FULL_43_16]|nr:MAG: phosphate acyltransferase [Deltaproteobacteria bacterium GWA2_43_19]OGQ11399.1 MAG: phosphate acyltransferase [Deltaproteobacteria bacterium RIFCSPHIGHO2_02_FULL_43_33]OGQ60411.1 MAG: phosphate acyltransferase [Deltaproteobacteria bacterium RIFCSPLOWO2_12_FULL_43_16]HBR17661.1 phosphate acyltransferase PlsX [Deltaproteobacteria bacterium]